MWISNSLLAKISHTSGYTSSEGRTGGSLAWFTNKKKLGNQGYENNSRKVFDEVKFCEWLIRPRLHIANYIPKNHLDIHVEW